MPFPLRTSGSNFVGHGRSASVRSHASSNGSKRRLPGARHRRGMSDYLKKAEKHAKLPKLDGALWHAYRRSWASARKHLSLVDVAAAGGWTDTGTLLRCY